MTCEGVCLLPTEQKPVETVPLPVKIPAFIEKMDENAQNAKLKEALQKFKELEEEFEAYRVNTEARHQETLKNHNQQLGA